MCFSFLGNLTNVVPYLEVARERTSRAISLQATVFQFSMSLGVSFASLLLGAFLSLSKAELRDLAMQAGAVRSFHLCFAALGGLCLLLALNGRRFRDEEFSSLAGKTPETVGE